VFLCDESEKEVAERIYGKEIKYSDSGGWVMYTGTEYLSRKKNFIPPLKVYLENRLPQNMTGAL